MTTEEKTTTDNILQLDRVLMSWLSPEIYNMVFQNHTQPLLDVLEALLLVHLHCAQPVWPVRITPTRLTWLTHHRRSTYVSSQTHRT